MQQKTLLCVIVHLNKVVIIDMSDPFNDMTHSMTHDNGLTCHPDDTEISKHFSFIVILRFQIAALPIIQLKYSLLLFILMFDLAKSFPIKYLFRFLCWKKENLKMNFSCPVSRQADIAVFAGP